MAEHLRLILGGLPEECIHQYELTTDIKFLTECMDQAAAVQAASNVAYLGGYKGTPAGTEVTADVNLGETEEIKKNCQGLRHGHCPYADMLIDLRSTDGLQSDIVKQAGGYPNHWRRG